MSVRDGVLGVDLESIDSESEFEMLEAKSEKRTLLELESEVMRVFEENPEP